MHHDRGEQGKGGLQLIPNPFGQALAGRVVQAWDVVQIVMVQLVVQRLEGALHIGKVHHPAHLRVQRTADMQLYPERMAVQAGALMAFRHIRQAVGGFEREGLEDVHGMRLRLMSR